MSYGKAVEEVWTWRESLAREIERLTPEQQIEHLNRKADEGIKKYGIKVKTLPGYTPIFSGRSPVVRKEIISI